ncbi:hypothetical protein ABTA53_18790 [Acinetobacter baumannii]
MTRESVAVMCWLTGHRPDGHAQASLPAARDRSRACPPPRAAGSADNDEQGAEADTC